jgi:hypothetical protein
MTKDHGILDITGTIRALGHMVLESRIDVHCGGRWEIRRECSQSTLPLDMEANDEQSKLTVWCCYRHRPRDTGLDFCREA